jgi:tetratricopeptide (TPR) repeat protein
LTFIEPKFISREEYSKLNWNILQKIEYSEDKEEENKKSIDRKDFKLFLPKDISKEDKIEVYNILEEDFSKELWFITWEKKIKAKIFYAIRDILENNNKINKNNEKLETLYKKVYNVIKSILEGNSKTNENNEKLKENNKKLEKNNKIYNELGTLYKKVSSEKKLPDTLEIEKFLKTLNKKEKLEFKREYITLARKLNGWQDISQILDSEVEFHFEELLLRNGVNNLRFWLSIMIQSEQDWIIEEEWEKIRKRKTLKEEEELLRKTIEIERYKWELEEVRKNWSEKEIAEKELEATNAIIKGLYDNFTYQRTKNKYWYRPSKILQTKELHCLWFSIVWHTFLEELGIKHKWMEIYKHSALEINIWWKKYYFSESGVWEVLEFEYWKQIWSYKEIKGVWWNVINENWDVKVLLSFSWNVEKIFLSQMYNSKWIFLYKLWRYEEAIKIHNKAIELVPESSDGYYNKWNALYKLWRYEEAIKMYDKAIELSPEFSNAYSNEWNALYKLWRYEEAIKMYDKAIEWDLENFDEYYNKWNAYEKLRRYEEAIKMYDKAIELDPENSNIYYNKWIVLHKLRRYKEAIQMYNKAIELNPERLDAYYNKWEALSESRRYKEGVLYKFPWNLINEKGNRNKDLYRKEKDIIRDYVKNKDFEWLRVYLLGLENEER